jgi:hypothetical protein
MENNLSLIASLQYGETLAICNEHAEKQNYNSWLTSFSRYYYSDNRKKTLLWIKTNIENAMLDPKILRPVVPNILQGLRNFSLTYQKEKYIVEEICQLMEKIIIWCDDNKLPISPVEFLMLNLLPSRQNLTLNVGLPTLQLDFTSFFKVLFYYGLKFSGLNTLADFL